MLSICFPSGILFPLHQKLKLSSRRRAVSGHNLTVCHARAAAQPAEVSRQYGIASSARTEMPADAITAPVIEEGIEKSFLQSPGATVQIPFGLDNVPLPTVSSILIACTWLS